MSFLLIKGMEGTASGLECNEDDPAAGGEDLKITARNGDSVSGLRHAAPGVVLTSSTTTNAASPGHVVLSVEGKTVDGVVSTKEGDTRDGGDAVEGEDAEVVNAKWGASWPEQVK